MVEELHLSLLGNLELRRDGVPIANLRSGKARALLCYLAVTGRPHLRPTLVGLLWEDMPEASAQNNLSKVLTYLRRAIGRHLRITRQSVAFNRESRYWLDVEAFESQAQSALAKANPAPAGIERLAAAVELYRGDFLEGFYVRQAPVFEEWVLVQRARLRELALQALHALVAHYARQGEAGTAAGTDYATRLLALEPWREETHRQLMLLLAKSGRRNAALAQYEACRRTLERELGVEPARETTDLYHSIRDGRELPADLSLPPHNLPAPFTPFVGREAELVRIGACLRDPDCRLLTLVGPGGSGKTRLALRAATDALYADDAHRFAHGIYWVPLAPLRSAEEIGLAIAQALGLAFRAASDPRQQLLDYLRRKNVLLILDNAEYLLGECSSNPSPAARQDGTGIVSDILQAAPNVKILVTSQARLNVHGEHLLPIAGMDVPPHPSPANRPSSVGGRGAPSVFGRQGEGLLRYSAVQLFLEDARRVQPDLAPTTAELAQIAHICQLVEGMPLGIVLAAPWVRVLPVAEIAGEIERSYDFLQAQQGDAPERQRSMRAAFEHSWNLLSERQQALLAALSVFRGGCTREAARQVAGASLPELMALIDGSLLHRASAGRFAMHELVREYAAEKLALSGVQGQVRDRHSACYLAALGKWADALKDARQRATLAEMDAEIDNLRAAWAWAVERGCFEPLERAAEGLSLYCGLRSRAPEGEAAFRAAADRLEGMYGAGGTGPAEGAPVEGLRALARMRLWQGVSACQWHLTAIARRSLRQSLELLDRPDLAACDLRLERGILLHTLGNLGFDAGHKDTGRRFEESLALFRALDNRWCAGRTLFFLGCVALDAAESGSAIRRFEEALALFRAQGDLRWSARVSIMASAVYLWMGRLEQGEPLAREGLALMQELGDRAGIALGLETLGGFACRAGEYVEFNALLERCLALWDDLGTRRTTVMLHAAEAKLHLGQYERARTLVRQEIDLLQGRGQQRDVDKYLDLLGMLALPGKAYEEAHRLLQQSISRFQELEVRLYLANTEAVIGYAARGIGRPDQAREHLAEALRMGREQDSWPPVVLALPAMALLLADRGEAERAIELYALACTFPYAAHSRWVEDVAGREIEALAATLPPEAVATARERGRTRDLWATVEELLGEMP